MTGPEREDPASPEPGQPPSAGPLDAATADLERLQAVLRRAAQGQAGVGEVTDSLRSYWQDNGAALTAAATALGDEVRRQMLGQLYQMRDRLDEQLGNRTSPPGGSGTPTGSGSGAPPGGEDSGG